MNPEPNNLKNIFIIGYRCTGKSSVGKLLAARLGWHFIDTDSSLVSKSGTSIKEIVKTQGWEAFRKMERDIVKHVCLHDRQVVATGGGVVLNLTNVDRMRAAGRIAWLRATPNTIRRRMVQDSETDAFRPALTSTDSVSEIDATLIEREPLYRNAMDFFVDTDERGTDEICDEILQKLCLR